MKNKKPNAELVWKQLEDHLAPDLGLTTIERTVYAHLLRHSRLEGKLRLRFSIRWLARNVGLSTGPVRAAVSRLIAQGALRLVQRSKTGHVVEVRLPEEIRAERPNPVESRADGGEDMANTLAAVNIEEADFLQNTTLRKNHPRARGREMFLLFAQDLGSGAVPGPRRAAGAVGQQFLPQRGLELHRMQFAERGEARARFSALALPRGSLELQRTCRPHSGSRRPRLRQAAA